MKLKTNKMKRQPMEWERIFKNYIYDKGLISQIYKELILLSSKNLFKKTKPTNHPIENWAQDLNRHPFK